MKILDKDLLEINNLYSQFIDMLVNDFRNNSDGSVQNALSFISVVYNNFINKKRDICPSIDNISSLCIYSLYGFQVCRTTNSMLFDFDYTCDKLHYGRDVRYDYARLIEKGQCDEARAFMKRIDTKEGNGRHVYYLKPATKIRH